jgi:hypothetical protein
MKPKGSLRNFTNPKPTWQPRLTGKPLLDRDSCERCILVIGIAEFVTVLP